MHVRDGKSKSPKTPQITKNKKKNRRERSRLREMISSRLVCVSSARIKLECNKWSISHLLIFLQNLFFKAVKFQTLKFRIRTESVFSDQTNAVPAENISPGRLKNVSVPHEEKKRSVQLQEAEQAMGAGLRSEQHQVSLQVSCSSRFRVCYNPWTQRENKKTPPPRMKQVPP